MTGDKRQTWGLIIDIFDVYERHGYKRGDHRHIGTAVSFIGEIGRIYEGTQDAPAGMQLDEASPMPAPAGALGPAPGADTAGNADEDRRMILPALDEAAEYKRDHAATCADCADQTCATCQYRLRMANAYEQVAQRLSDAGHFSRSDAARQREPDPGPHREAGTDREAVSGPEESPDWEAGR